MAGPDSGGEGLAAAADGKAFPTAGRSSPGATGMRPPSVQTRIKSEKVESPAGLGHPDVQDHV